MRITIVLGPFLPVPAVLGGAVEKVHALLAEAYRAGGHDVTIMSRKYGNFPSEEVVDGIKHIRIDSFDRKSSLIRNLALDFCYALRVSRRLPQSDITITNSFFLPMLLRRRTAGKIYVHVARFPKYQMWLYSGADRLQAVSRSVANEIIRQTPGLAPKIEVIGYPVPDSYFARSPAVPRKKIILFVGRIAREKGVDLLLKAFALVFKICPRQESADWKLRIVGPFEQSQGGDGAAYQHELMRLAEPLGSSCEFVGPVFEERQLVKEYQSASVFIYPSLAERGEALGLAPIEAMAAGCAVVVSNLECFDDFVHDGENGFKFDHRCNDADKTLAALLMRLIDDPELMEKIAKNGSLSACKFRTAEIAGKMLTDFYALVTNKK